MSRRFLIVKPSSLGDVLHAFPAVAALCRESGAKADWLIHPAFSPLLKYMPCVENAILFQRKKLGKISSFFPAYRELKKDLRKNQYDAVIDLQGLFRSALIAKQAKAPYHAGPEKPREGIAKLFYNKHFSQDPGIHALLKNNQAVAHFLGKKTDEIDFSFTLPVVEENLQSANALLENAGISPDQKNCLIGLAPGARWITKQWKAEFFAELVSELKKRIPAAHFILLGTSDDIPAAETIISLCGNAPHVTSLCGKTTLGDLLELTRMCTLFVSNDSGPMHIAAALDVPVLALFGPTDPVLTGPFTERKTILQPENVSCIRCMKRQCADMRCQDAVSPVNAADRAVAMIRNDLARKNINIIEEK